MSRTRIPVQVNANDPAARGMFIHGLRSLTPSVPVRPEVLPCVLRHRGPPSTARAVHKAHVVKAVRAAIADGAGRRPPARLWGLNPPTPAPRLGRRAPSARRRSVRSTTDFGATRSPTYPPGRRVHRGVPIPVRQPTRDTCPPPRSKRAGHSGCSSGPRGCNARTPRRSCSLAIRQVETVAREAVLEKPRALPRYDRKTASRKRSIHFALISDPTSVRLPWTPIFCRFFLS